MLTKQIEKNNKAPVSRGLFVCISNKNALNDIKCPDDIYECFP